MGTRHLVCVVKDKQFKVAQYGQWDGYPEGQGKTVVKFLTSPFFDLNHFRSQVDKTKALTDAEVNARWKANGADDSGFVGMDVVGKFEEKNYHLSRDCGADILAYVDAAPDPEVHLSTNFAADSLFCEWAYVIDLDKEVLEVYKGFNKKPLGKTQRFQFLDKGGEYRPIRLFKKFKLATLKKDWDAFRADEEGSDQ